MKKKLCVLFVLAMVLLLTFTLAGCNESHDGYDEAEDDNLYDTKIDAGELSDYLAGNITFADELTKVDNDIACEIYGIDENAVSDMAVYMSSGATAEEIAVITVGDDDAALLAGEAISSRIQQQKTGFENYVPEEIPKLENAVIRQVNSAVIMIVCDNADEADAAINGYVETYLK